MRKLPILVKLSVGAALAVGAFGVFMFVSRPTHDPQLIGVWKGNPYPKNVYTFRKDGTYEATSFDANVRGFRDVEFKSSGTWLYRPNEIIFSRAKNQAFQNGKPFPKILDLIDPIEKRTGGIPIKWLDEKRWAPTQVGIGHFQKVGS